MSDYELFDLAARQEWPALIKHLGKLDVGEVNKQILFKGSSGMCVFMCAAAGNAPAPVWKALIEAALRVGLDLQSILTRVSGGKWTVLHLAASSSGDEVCCCLSVLCPSALDMKNGFNMTPLEVAKACNRPSLTQAVNGRAGFLKQQLEVRRGTLHTDRRQTGDDETPPMYL